MSSKDLTSINIGEHLLKRIRKYNRRHPEHPINISAASRSVLISLLKEHENNDDD